MENCEETPDILGGIESPADIKALSEEQLKVLAGQIRRRIIETTSVTGGHVASSLGAVEIILAVHSLIDAPKDKFIFDVGHQAYAHKLITGRRDTFDTLRQFGGLSGFPKPNESAYDVHPSGHASDSLSIALGLAKASKLKGTNERIVVLIGDASIAGGMAFEALNLIGQAQLPITIILNDNEMSISRNVGALMKHFGALRTSAHYRKTRDDIQEKMEESGKVTRALLNFGRNVKDSVKHFFIPQVMIFEQLGIVCTAPVDGNDIHALREMIATAMRSDGPTLVHAVTKKGAGYKPALDNPEKFHGIGPYDIETGATNPPRADAPITFTAAFGSALVDEARHDERIVAMTAAMKGGTGLSAFDEAFPERFIDGGIAEENVVGSAAGLAFGGMKPVVAIYSTFLQRAVDQTIIDVALSNLDVVFAIDRAGLVGEDGPTHHGVFDMAYMRMVPGMRVLAPSDEVELAHALHTALALGGPFAIRYPRGAASGKTLPAFEAREVWTPGEARVVSEGSDVALLAFGRMVSVALKVSALLAAQGVSARVVDMRWVKPLSRRAVEEALRLPLVATLEEGCRCGGVGEGVLSLAEELRAERADAHRCTTIITFALPDEFVTQGKTDKLLQLCGLDAESIAAKILAAR